MCYWGGLQELTKECGVMTDGVSVLVADPGANKLLTAAFTCKHKQCLRLLFKTTIPARETVLIACVADLI